MDAQLLGRDEVLQHALGLVEESWSGAVQRPAEHADRVADVGAHCDRGVQQRADYGTVISFERGRGARFGVAGKVHEVGQIGAGGRLVLLAVRLAGEELGGQLLDVFGVPHDGVFVGLVNELIRFTNACDGR